MQFFVLHAECRLFATSLISHLFPYSYMIEQVNKNLQKMKIRDIK